MFSTARQFGLFSLRRLVGCAVLLSICLAILPLSLPTLPGALKDSSAPFPCQNRPCGCQTAEQCWRKCCCFTNAQKVAWAKANDVKIPEFVVAAAINESKAVNPVKVQVTVDAERPALCGCRAIPVAGSAALDGNATCCVKQPKTPGSSPSKKRSGRHVLGLFAEGCRGEHGSISALPLAVPPTDIAIVRANVLLSRSLPPASEAGAGLSRRPAIPPPRMATCFFICPASSTDATPFVIARWCCDGLRAVHVRTLIRVGGSLSTSPDLLIRHERATMRRGIQRLRRRSGFRFSSSSR